MGDVKRKHLEKHIAEMLMHSSFPEEPFHSGNTLEWVVRLMPGEDDALRIAALGHDIERSYPERRVRTAGYGTYEQFKEAHALNSAHILSELMEEAGLEQVLIDDVARLVAHHESGGNKREEALKNADTLSFFQVCLPLYFDRHGPERTRKRMVWGYRKLPQVLRGEIGRMEFPDPDLEALVRDATTERDD